MSIKIQVKWTRVNVECLQQNDGEFRASQLIAGSHVIHKLPLDDDLHFRVGSQNRQSGLVLVLLAGLYWTLDAAVQTTVGLGQREGNPDAQNDPVHFGVKDWSVLGRFEIYPDRVIVAPWKLTGTFGAGFYRYGLDGTNLWPAIFELDLHSSDWREAVNHRR